MIIPLLRTCKICVKLLNPLYHHKNLVNYKKSAIFSRRLVSSSASRLLRISQDEGPSDSDSEDFNSEKYSSLFYNGYARDLLFKNTKDLLLQRIYCSASVEEVFKVLEKNTRNYKSEHLTLTVFVLNDLLRFYQELSRGTNGLFLEQLNESEHFQKLLEMIQNNVHNFDLTLLSYCTLYLNKLGIGPDSEILQLLCKELKNKLLNNFSLEFATHFLETVFSEATLRPYFFAQELAPLVFKKIDCCQSSNELKHLTICLNKLHNFVTPNIIEKYRLKVELFIKNGFLQSQDYKTLLQVITFLNYPKWREKCSALISNCMFLMQKSMNQMSLEEIVLFYQIFFLIQEPACILNDLQRCSYKHYHQLEDFPTLEKITLFSSLIFFASTNLRKDFQTKLKKYVNDCDDFNSFLLLGKMLSSVKVSDINLCNLYWSKARRFIKNENIDFLKLGQNYLHFSADVNNFRHREFEQAMLEKNSQLYSQAECHFLSQNITSIMNFQLMYGKDLLLLNELVKKFESNWEQFKPIDCLKISYALKLFDDLEKKSVNKLQYARRIDKTLEKFINKESECIDDDLWKNNALLKICVYKNTVNTNLAIKLLKNYKKFDHISSKNIENIYYCSFMTNLLVPEVLDNIIDYIISYKSNVLAFNVGRILYLCFCFGYHPQKIEEFCRIATDIIIRDQERLTGLLLIQSALSLCFFNKLPNSLIRSIFNVEFMDKLDQELQQCYSKEKYPQRVRNGLMQLNRAVCLEYPENNVPWFHQKYISESATTDQNKHLLLFSTKVSEYLFRIVPKRDDLALNVITPYGYCVDFLIGLDYENRIVHYKEECAKKLAILLIPEYAYTNVVPRLKGSFQLKRRHLEILGYRVIFIKFSDWISLFYAEERIDFLKNLIWPKNEINKVFS